MRKNFLLLALLAMTTFAFAENEKTNDAIYAWVDGSSTCYKLESMPQVTYESDKAVLTVDGSTKLELTLTDGATLEITYGEYEMPTSVENTVVTREGKIIRGGRLIIVKDGQMYDVNGALVK